MAGKDKLKILDKDNELTEKQKEELLVYFKENVGFKKGTIIVKKA